MPLPRLATVDSLRGVLLVVMTINHLPGPHRDYTFDTVGYFTVAEGFVFISGLIAGLHGYDVLLTRGEAAMRSVFYRRARTLYFSQLILLALLFGVGEALAAINGNAANPLLADYVASWSNSLHPLFIAPFSAAGAALLLLYQPPLFDVLPMYCIFLFFTPFYLCWIQKGRGVWLLLCGFIFWLIAQGHVTKSLLLGFPADWSIHDFVFDPLAWQLLFVGGVVLGGSVVKNGWTWRPSNAVLVLALAVVTVFVYVRHVPATMDWKIFLGQVSYRGTLAPLRLASCAAIFACVGVWARRFPGWFTWEPLVRLGRNSLYIFLYQIALIYFVSFWCDRALTLPHGGWVDLGLILLFTSTLWIAAAAFDRIKSWRRARW
jgi:hypothetical protein